MRFPLLCTIALSSSLGWGATRERAPKIDFCQYRLMVEAANVRAMDAGLHPSFDTGPWQMSELDRQEDAKFRALYAQWGPPLQVQMRLNLKPFNGDPAVRAGTGFNFTNLDAGVLHADNFSSLNRYLGPAGIWFVYRAYSWRHLGFENAGPHLTVIVGDRAFEIGRIPTRKSAGPISLSVDELIEKFRRESAILNADPGIFFAQRITAPTRNLAALAKYYEDAARRFGDGEDFVYCMDPSVDAQGQNCLTYLLAPFLQPELVPDADLRQTVGIRRFGLTPIDQMRFMSSNHLLRNFLVIEGGMPPQRWRQWTQGVWQFRTAQPDGSAPHPQLAPFFVESIFYSRQTRVMRRRGGTGHSEKFRRRRSSTSLVS